MPIGSNTINSQKLRVILLELIVSCLFCIVDWVLLKSANDCSGAVGDCQRQRHNAGKAIARLDKAD